MSDAERITGALEVLVISLRQCVTIGPKLTQKVADHMESAVVEIDKLRAQVAHQAEEILKYKMAGDNLCAAALIVGESADKDIAALSAKVAESEKDAARYQWWREHGPAIFEDPDGIPAAAFSCQIPLPDIESLSGAELIDLIADRCIAVRK